MDVKKYKGFDDSNIEKDFKPQKKSNIPDLPKFLEDKKKIKKTKDAK